MILVFIPILGCKNEKSKNSKNITEVKNNSSGKKNDHTKLRAARINLSTSKSSNSNSGWAADLEKMISGLQQDKNQSLQLNYKLMSLLYGHYLGKKKFSKNILEILNHKKVTIKGVVVPVEVPDKECNLKRFWLANPIVVMAGCVFCNPPTLGDLIYVDMNGKSLKADRGVLYSTMLKKEITGRFVVGYTRSKEGYEYLFKIEAEEIK